MLLPVPRVRFLSIALFLAALALGAAPDARAQQAILVTNSAVGIAENGGTYEQRVSLSAAPTGTVTVRIEVRDTSIATVDVATLTFTPQNYGEPQTVTITAVNDNTANRGGGRRTMVDLTASGGGYDGITSAITVWAQDDDLQVRTDRLLEGTSLTYRLRYTLDGVTDSAHIDLKSLTPGVISVSPSTMTWLGTQSGQWRYFTVTALDNQEMGDGYGRISLTIRHVGPSASTPPATPDWAWTVTDDETPALLASPSGTTVRFGDGSRGAAVYEGGETGSFTLRLAARPTGPVTVTVGGTEGTDLSLDRTFLSFTRANWDSPQKVTISARHDDDMKGDFARLTLAATGGGYDSATADVLTYVFDDDTPGLVISKEVLRFVEGESLSYTVALKSRPTGPVTVTVTPGGNPEADLTPDKTELTFTPTDWNRPQTVTVTAGADAKILSYSATLFHTATGGGYDSAAANVAVDVIDGGKPALVVSKQYLTVPEGGKATFTLRLSQKPTGMVTVNMNTGLGPDPYRGVELTLNPTALTFTMTDWSIPQTVTVSAAEDDNAYDGEANISLGDVGYNSNGGWMVATEEDNDEPGILVSPSPLIVAEGAAAGFTVRLASQPSRNVAVTIGGMAGTDLTLDKDILNFTTTDWDTPQTVTATAAQDEDRRDDSVPLSFAAFAGSEDEYTGPSERLVVAVEDDDAPRVVSLSASRYEAVEGETLEVKVSLSEARAVDTTVPVRIASRSGDTATSGADYNGNVRTVTIPAGGTSAIVRIPIMADKHGDPNETFAVTIPEAEVPDGVVPGASRVAVVTIRERVSGVTPPAVATVAYAGADSTIRLTVPAGLQGHGVDVAFRYYTEHGTARGGLDCRDPDADLVDRAVTGTPGEVVNGPVVRRVQDLDADTVDLKIELCPGSRGKTFDVLWDTSNYLGDPDRGFPGIDSAPFNAAAAHCRSGNLCWTRVTIEGGNTRESACVSPGLEADVRRYAGEAHNGDAHVDRWKRVLAAFSGDNGYTPMAAAEAQQNADQFSASRWDPVATALQCLEAAPAAEDTSVQAGPGITVEGGGDIAEGADAVFTVHADPAPASDLTVTLTVEDDAVSDFLAEGNEGTQTVTIQAGQSSATLTLATENDSTDEPDGSVSATVAGGTGYTVGSPDTAAVAVSDDDEPVVSVAAGSGVTEGAPASFTLTATPAPHAALTVILAVTQSGDYAAEGETGTRNITIPTGGSIAFEVATVNDGADEPDGSVTATLAAGTGYAVAASPDDTASVAVSDDDAAAGVPTLSVNDVEVKEGRYRRVEFTVTLSEASRRGAWFYWRVRESSPVSAKLNEDFWASTSKQFASMRPGQTEHRIKAAMVIDDSHDEDPETFEIVLSDATHATIADGVGVATIVNDDPMPAAFLARFGRTAAEQALDGIAGRIAASRMPGARGTIAGQALTFDPEAQPPEAWSEAANDNAAIAAFSGTGSLALSGLGASAGRFGTVGFGQGLAQSRTMTGLEALLGSSFTATGETDGTGGSLAFWGRVAQSSFDGREGTFSLDGETTTAMLGADYARGRWLVGLALMQSSGEGGYADAGTGSVRCPQPLDAERRRVLCGEAVREGEGKVEATLAAAIPYAAVQASERLKLWGAFGYGAGDVTLKPETGGALKADISWSMAAMGMRGDLLPPLSAGSGPALALTSDALWAVTSSDKTHELAASESDVTRLRLGLEGSWGVALAGGASLTPRLELGVRHDGGDAETGSGVELGGGLSWVDPGLGLSLDLSGRTLVAHDDSALEDRGVSASLVFAPDAAGGRGPSFSLGQDWGGQAQGGLDALFAPEPLEKREGGGKLESRWSAEAAWGFPALGGRFTGSPHMGLGLAAGARDYTLGWRLAPATGANALSLGVTATRREIDTVPAEHRLGFEAAMRW